MIDPRDIPGHRPDNDREQVAALGAATPATVQDSLMVGPGGAGQKDAMSAGRWPMSELTLPGDIPGLLRRGSPLARNLGVVVRVRPGGRVRTGDDAGGDYYDAKCLALDLSDPTGRAHAAWWLRVHMRNPARTASKMGESWEDLLGAVHEAERSHDELDESWIDILRRVVLHVAGREVTP